ncbi:phage tail assembly chaperone [Paenibacillus xylanexedens]|nr:hypothetical protein [Paenibacillus xylanexedens]
MGGEWLLGKMVLGGEFGWVGEEVQKVKGLNEDMKEVVDEVKK